MLRNLASPQKWDPARSVRELPGGWCAHTRSVLPAGTVSRKREIGFMGLVLGGRESGRRREKEGEAPPRRAAWKTLSWSRAEQSERDRSKVATVQSEFLILSQSEARSEVQSFACFFMRLL